MKGDRKRTYKTTYSEADKLAMSYVSILASIQEAEDILQSRKQSLRETEEKLKYLLSSTKTKKAAAYLIEFTLDQNGNLIQNFSKKGTKLLDSLK